MTLIVFCSSAFSPAYGQTLSELESQVGDIFSQSCARVGCHAGSDPQMGLSLEADLFVDHTVQSDSRERPDLQLAHPGEPDSSYLVKKVRGDEDIIGGPMPMTGNPLSDSEIETIASWIQALGETDLSDRATPSAAKTVNAFSGWKVVNLPTTRMVDARTWLFLIGHRFNPQLSAGYDAFWGLDGSGIIFLSMGYAPSNDLLISLGRSNLEDNVELETKIRLLNQTQDGRIPLSLALRGAVNWITEQTGEEDRWQSESFKVSGQAVLSRELSRNLGVLVAPGLLVNQDAREDGEGLLVTVGVGGRWRFHRNLSLVAEWVPILTGYMRSVSFGNVNRFDSFGGGLEIAVGGHVFQIVATNSVGLATDQYMRGGDLDVGRGDFRLGFNIYRLLRF
ncbi:MAG: DUF5777 family beta-barrel protein [Rhodothermales bacterium]